MLSELALIVGELRNEATRALVTVSKTRQRRDVPQQRYKCGMSLRRRLPFAI